MVIHKFFMFFEAPDNPLRRPHSDSWFNHNIWSDILDAGLQDIQHHMKASSHAAIPPSDGSPHGVEIPHMLVQSKLNHLHWLLGFQLCYINLHPRLLNLEPIKPTLLYPAIFYLHISALITLFL
ncbi:unnamed protein product [Tuber aestivum]|uniref:Uncharacterized protein n=1 Tax=Tuber aestivum TaxID=59557 RepID=A0A292PJU4_9PEZI|nr:unnamed protein product [Tuber aestivum]